MSVIAAGLEEEEGAERVGEERSAIVVERKASEVEMSDSMDDDDEGAEGAMASRA